MSDSKEILKKHGLKFTKNREVILEQFMCAKYALSYKDIDELISKKLDKVTVYRTLKSFQEAGLIHEVMDGSSIDKYALCHSSSCTSHQHHDAHVHFKCDDCEKTFCLDDVVVPSLNLPQGFKTQTQTTFLNGTCDTCTTH